MRFSKEADQIELEANEEEALLLSNVLNEVCNGFVVPDFEAVIGASKREAGLLFDRLRTRQSGRGGIPVTSAEIAVLKNALGESLRELGPDEFQTRTGVAFTTGQKALKEFHAVP